MIDEVINKLDAIQKEHSEFFGQAKKNITDYITEGSFNSGVFINSDLPKVITDKIRKIFDEYSLTQKLK